MVEVSGRYTPPEAQAFKYEGDHADQSPEAAAWLDDSGTPENRNPDQAQAIVPETSRDEQRAGLAPKSREKAKRQVEKLSPEELKARTEKLASLALDTRKREQERCEQRWGKGLFGKVNKWLNTTNFGKTVKILGSVAIGAGEIVGSGALAGTPGMLLSPAIFGDGSGRIAGALTEAGQFWLGKSRSERVKMEAAKRELFAASDELAKVQELYKSQVESGQMSEEKMAQYYEKMSELTAAIGAKDKEVLDLENQNIGTENRNKRVRTVVRATTTVAFSLLHGVPLGIQHWGGGGHAVRLGMHGMDYIYKAGEQMSANSSALHGFLGGAVGHTTGGALPFAGKVGLGVAAIGLANGFARGMRKNGEISQNALKLPDFMKVNPDDQSDPLAKALREGARATSATVEQRQAQPEAGEKNLDALKQRLAENNQKISELEQQKSEKETTLASTEVDPRAQETAKAEIDGLRGQAETYEKATKDLVFPEDVPIDMLDDGERTLQTQIGEKRTENRQANENVKRMSSRLAEIWKTKNELDKGKDTRPGRIAELQQEIQRNGQQIDALSNNAEEQQALGQRNWELQHELDQLQAQEQQAEQTNNELMAALTEFTNWTEARDASEQDLAKAEDEFKAKMAEKAAKIREEIAQKESQQPQTVEAAKANPEEIAEIDRQIEALKKENEEIEAQIRALEEGVEDDTSQKKAPKAGSKEEAEEAPKETSQQTAEKKETAKQTIERGPNHQKFIEFTKPLFAEIDSTRTDLQKRAEISAKIISALDNGEIQMPESIDLAHIGDDMTKWEESVMRVMTCLPNNYLDNPEQTNAILEKVQTNIDNLIESSTTINGEQPVDHETIKAFYRAVDKFKRHLNKRRETIASEKETTAKQKELRDKTIELDQLEDAYQKGEKYDATQQARTPEIDAAATKMRSDYREKKAQLEADIARLKKELDQDSGEAQRDEKIPAAAESVKEERVSPEQATENMQKNEKLMQLLGKLVIPQLIRDLPTSKNEEDLRFSADELSERLTDLGEMPATELSQTIISDITKIKDILENSTIPFEERLKQSKEGVDQLISTLRRELRADIVQSSVGDKFDGRIHQAIGVVETEDPTLDKTIAKVGRAGIVMDGWHPKNLQGHFMGDPQKRSLAPEMVTVYRYKAKEPAVSAEKMGDKADEGVAMAA